MSLTGYNPYTYAPGFRNNEFHHAVLSVSGTWHTLYLDGVQVAQNLSGGNIFASYQTITNTVIGAQTSLAQAFQGTIDDVRVYNYAIPQTLVTSLYRDRNLVVYYPFDSSVNSLTPNYATLAYDASLIGQPLISASAGANVGSGALALTNSATTVATQYVKTTPVIAGQTGWQLNAANGVTIACWINVAGVAGRVQRIFDIPLSVGSKGLAVDISGTNMLYTGWYPVAPIGPIDLLSAATKTAMLGTGKSAGAFGTQLLYSGYVGPVMQIKNGISGTPTDFYADTSGNLGTAYLGTGTPLATFLSGAVAYVTKWYDQTGNGNHTTGVGGASSPIYITATKTVDFTNGYFSLPIGAYPSGNSAYTYIFTPNNINDYAIVYIGGTTGTNDLMCGGYLYYLSTSTKYYNAWWGDNLQYNDGPLLNGVKITDCYDGTTGSGRKLYLNNSLITPTSLGTGTRAQTNINNYLGYGITQDSNTRNYTGTLKFFYWAPIKLNDADRNFLECTGTTPFAYYPFDISANSLSPNIASDTPVYDFSLNSNASIAVPASSYSFLGTNALYISSRISSSNTSTKFAIVRIPSNTSVSYTATMWFNLTSIIQYSGIFGSRNSTADVGANDSGCTELYFNTSATDLVVWTSGSTNVSINTIKNSAPSSYASAGWYFCSMTVNATSSTAANVNVKIISSNNTNNFNNINYTNSFSYNTAILAPKVFVLGDVPNGTLNSTGLGYYDNFQFYSSPLTQQQILNLYYNNSATLNTVNNYSVNITYNFVNIAATPAAITADAVMNSFTGAYAAFVSSIGTSPTLSGPAISVTNGGIYTTATAPSIQTFSATTNFCMGAALPTTNNVDIFNFGGTPNTSTSYRFYITSTGVLTGAVGTGYTSPVAFATLAVNTWYHIAVSFTITGFTLYLNGVAQTPGSGSAAVTGISGFTSVGLGYSASTNTTYYNYWKYFGYTLSASDVSTIYASDFYKVTVQVVSDYDIYYPLTGSSSISSTQLYNGKTNTYEGTLVNSPVMSSTNYIISPSSLYFSSNAYCTLPTFTNTSTQFSISLWFNKPTVGDHTLFLASNGNDLIQIFTQAASTMLTCLLTNGPYSAGTANSNTNIVSISANTWYHLAWVVNGTNWSVYLNNTLYTYSSKSSPTIISHTTIFGNANALYSVNGYLQDFRIYYRTLTAAEVTSIYNYRGGGDNTTLTPYVYLPLTADTNNTSANTTAVTVQGSLSFTTIANKQCVYFNNNNGYTNSLTFPFTYSTTFTICYWIYGVTAPTGTPDYTACTITNAITSQTHVLSDYYSTSFTYAQLYVALSTQWTNTGNISFTASKWTHIAYSINGTSAKLYVNGTLSQTITGTANMPNNANSIIMLGRGPSRGFNGYMSQFQFYNSVLSDTQIQTVYYTS